MCRGHTASGGGRGPPSHHAALLLMMVTESVDQSINQPSNRPHGDRQPVKWDRNPGSRGARQPPAWGAGSDCRQAHQGPQRGARRRGVRLGTAVPRGRALSVVGAVPGGSRGRGDTGGGRGLSPGLRGPAHSLPRTPRGRSPPGPGPSPVVTASALPSCGTRCWPLQRG